MEEILVRMIGIFSMLGGILFMEMAVYEVFVYHCCIEIFILVNAVIITILSDILTKEYPYNEQEKV